MSRFESKGPVHALAFGTDYGILKDNGHGQLVPRTFVQVWDHREFDQPCNEGKGGFNNILVNKWDVSDFEIQKLAKEYNVPLNCNVRQELD